MAKSGQIDLKQAQLFIRDGYANVGAVNLIAGYAAGLATMVVDEIVGVIPTGATFTLVGDDTIYEVVSHIETSGHTTSLTFVPALVEPAVDGQVITFLANSIEVRIGEGNLTYDQKKPREYKKDRGRLYLVRNADEVELEVAFDFVWDHIVGSTGDPITIEEALTGEGRASYWVSSSTEACEPYAVDLVVLYTPECEDIEPEQIIFRDFRHDSMNHNMKDGTVACKGASNRTKPEATRLAVA